MKLLLGIDGGGSGCRARLADGDGRILGEGRAGPANIRTDREGALANILACAGAALGGRAPADVSACLGLAGASFAEPAAWLMERLPFARARITDDALTSLAGAFGGDDGIVAAIGTGSVFSRQIGGEVLTIGGWGLELGDEASGAWLGRGLLAHALRAQDGLAPGGPLVDGVLAEFGHPTDLVAFAEVATAADYAAFAPRVFSAPATDSVAEALLAPATAYVAAAVARLHERPELPVAFLGGLGSLYAQRLDGRWPLVAPRGTALDGALHLARAMMVGASC